MLVFRTIEARNMVFVAEVLKADLDYFCVTNFKAVVFLSVLVFMQ